MIVEMIQRSPIKSFKYDVLFVIFFILLYCNLLVNKLLIPNSDNKIAFDYFLRQMMLFLCTLSNNIGAAVSFLTIRFVLNLRSNKHGSPINCNELSSEE